MCGVILGQVGVRRRIAEIVDRNDLYVMLFTAFVVSAKHVAADTAIAIDGNLDGHGDLLMVNAVIVSGCISAVLM